MEITTDMLMLAYSRITKISFYQIFIAAVIFDIMTGYAKAFIRGKADSKIGAKGLLKHLTIVALVFAACPYLWLVGYAVAARFLLTFFIINYGISILENFEEIGVRFPPGVKQLFKQMQDKADAVSFEDINKKE